MLRSIVSDHPITIEVASARDCNRIDGPDMEDAGGLARLPADRQATGSEEL